MRAVVGEMDKSGAVVRRPRPGVVSIMAHNHKRREVFLPRLTAPADDLLKRINVAVLGAECDDVAASCITIASSAAAVAGWDIEQLRAAFAVALGEYPNMVRAAAETEDLVPKTD